MPNRRTLLKGMAAGAFAAPVLWRYGGLARAARNRPRERDERERECRPVCHSGCTKLTHPPCQRRPRPPFQGYRPSEVAKILRLTPKAPAQTRAAALCCRVRSLQRE